MTAARSGSQNCKKPHLDLPSRYAHDYPARARILEGSLATADPNGFRQQSAVSRPMITGCSIGGHGGRWTLRHLWRSLRGFVAINGTFDSRGPGYNELHVDRVVCHGELLRHRTHRTGAISTRGQMDLPVHLPDVYDGQHRRFLICHDLTADAHRVNPDETFVYVLVGDYEAVANDSLRVVVGPQ